MLVANDNRITLCERSRNHRGAAKYFCSFSCQLTVAVFVHTSPDTGIWRKLQRNVVRCRDLDDEAGDGTNINAGPEARCARSEHVAGGMSVAKDQHPAMAD